MASSSRINLVRKRPEYKTKNNRMLQTELCAHVHAAMRCVNGNETTNAPNETKWNQSEAPILYLTATNVIHIYYTRSVDEMSIKNQLKINTEAWQITAQSISKRQISIIKIIRFKRHIKWVSSTRKRQRDADKHEGARAHIHANLFFYFSFTLLWHSRNVILFDRQTQSNLLRAKN